jgi:hypothetical protein
MVVSITGNNKEVDMRFEVYKEGTVAVDDR